MLIMLHGIGDRGAAMSPIAEALGGRLHTYAPSRRPLPAYATFDDTVEDVVKQLDEEEIDRAFLLGYSFGGLIALTIARRYPERVLGVIGLAAKVFYDDKTISYLKHIVSVDHISKMGPAKVKAYEQRWGLDLPTLTRSAMNMYESFHSKPPLSDEDLRAIEPPVLLISGKRDQVTSADETRRLADLIPNAQLDFFPGEAHPMRAVPADHVKASVLRFVREVERGQFSAAPAEAMAGA